jgi:hypothetical protein
VLIEQRRRRHVCCALAIELHSRTDCLLGTVRTLHGHAQAEMPHLRILHDLIDAIDGRKRNIVCSEALDPVR